MKEPLVRIEIFNNERGIIREENNIQVFNKQNSINCDDWQSLLKLVKDVPACQLVGNPECGKAALIKKLIQENKDMIFIVFDIHGEYTDLPITDCITPNLAKSCRLDLPKQPDGALAMFKLWKGVIMSEKLPDNYVLIIDYATRFLKAGLEDLVAEAEKYCKIIIVAQRKVFNFCPALYITSDKKAEVKC